MTSGVRQIALETPFTDQKPGTSGLRKSSRHFATPHYLESFIEAILRTVPGVQGGTLVVGGDGRFGNREACLLYTSPSPRDRQKSRMPSSA